MIQVVLDTNIVVSAMLRSGSLPEAAFNLAVDRIVQLCISKPILAEYEEVMRRSKFAQSAAFCPDHVRKARTCSLGS